MRVEEMSTVPDFTVVAFDKQPGTKEASDVDDGAVFAALTFCARKRDAVHKKTSQCTCDGERWNTACSNMRII